MIILRVLESWDQFREILDWERAKHGCGPVNQENFRWLQVAIGEPPRIPQTDWVSWRREASGVSHES